MKAEYVLLTHCHFDHVGGVAELIKAGARVLCTEVEKPLFHTAHKYNREFQNLCGMKCHKNNRILLAVKIVNI